MDPHKCLGLYALALLGLISGAAPAQGPAGPANDLPLTTLAPGDQVKMEVYGHPDMGTTTAVGADGTIRIPLGGLVQVAGLSPADAEKKVESAYKTGLILVNPHVTLTVAASLSRVTVLGEVKTPGRYPIDSSTTVLDVLALAGGRTEKGDDAVFLLRQDEHGEVSRYPINLMAVYTDTADVPEALTFRLHNGDRILVPPASQYIIVGEVHTPATYRLQAGLTLQQAIALAGGITDKGSMRRIEIKRRKPNGDYAVLSGKPTDTLQAGDLITVKERIF